MKKVITLLAVFVCLFSNSFSQHEQDLSEIEWTVPELSSYHEVIYPMWHTAYPNKDFELFKQLLPDINSGAEKIYSAKLPGILRDKENEWKEGVEKLRISVESYNKAVAENNEPGILSSAEVLHSNYEMLVRIIRPVTKEVDEFHKVLYMIYHHYAPEKQTPELNDAVDSLVVRAANLKNSTLPKRAASKKEHFLELAEELESAVRDLQKAKNEGTANLDEAIEIVHTKYQKLEALFD